MGERLRQQYPIQGNNALKAEVYNYQRPRELVSSNSFSVEHAPVVTDGELEDEIISYLGEFRFGLKKYDYSLVYSHTDDEGWRLRDPHRLEAMGIKARRSVAERKMLGQSTNREEAEGEGLNSLDRQLESAQEGDSIVWVSPPGTPEEGYGDYGFIFVGKVKRSAETRKEISMTAIRVKSPTIARFNVAFRTLSGESLSFLKAEDFLRNPAVLNGQLSEAFIDATLGEIFQAEQDPRQGERFKRLMEMTKTRRKRCINILKSNRTTVQEKIDYFHGLENLVLELDGNLRAGVMEIYKQPEGDAMFVQEYGYEPPQQKGSCPIIRSANSLNQNFPGLNNALGSLLNNGEEWDGKTYKEAGPCRLCGKDVVCGPCKVCQVCTEADNAKQLAA